MPGLERQSEREVVRILLQFLQEGRAVEVDGLGCFHPDGTGQFRFEPRRGPKVFLAYVEEDFPAVNRLYRDLAASGYSPWMDKWQLLPGQNWLRAIEEAIETSDFVVAALSRESVKKRGTFQAEIRLALECAQRVPLDSTFLLPIRLDACTVPRRIKREFQYIDFFPDWDRGLLHLRAALERRAPRPK